MYLHRQNTLVLTVSQSIERSPLIYNNTYQRQIHDGVTSPREAANLTYFLYFSEKPLKLRKFGSQVRHPPHFLWIHHYSSEAFLF